MDKILICDAKQICSLACCRFFGHRVKLIDLVFKFYWAEVAQRRMTAATYSQPSAVHRYGYRRIAALLRDAGWQVNDKRVERLWRKRRRKATLVYA